MDAWPMGIRKKMWPPTKFGAVKSWAMFGAVSLDVATTPYFLEIVLNR